MSKSINSKKISKTISIAINGDKYNSLDEMPQKERQQIESILSDENQNNIPDIVEDDLLNKGFEIPSTRDEFQPVIRTIDIHTHETSNRKNKPKIQYSINSAQIGLVISIFLLIGFIIVYNLMR